MNYWTSSIHKRKIFQAEARILAKTRMESESSESFKQMNNCNKLEANGKFAEFPFEVVKNE